MTYYYTTSNSMRDGLQAIASLKFWYRSGAVDNNDIGVVYALSS